MGSLGGRCAVGAHDRRGLFQPYWFHDSMILNHHSIKQIRLERVVMKWSACFLFLSDCNIQFWLAQDGYLCIMLLYTMNFPLYALAVLFHRDPCKRLFLRICLKALWTSPGKSWARFFFVALQTPSVIFFFKFYSPVLIVSYWSCEKNSRGRKL